jgi:small subunit ribosomal protein S14
VDLELYFRPFNFFNKGKLYFVFLYMGTCVFSSISNWPVDAPLLKNIFAFIPSFRNIYARHTFYCKRCFLIILMLKFYIELSGLRRDKKKRQYFKQYECFLLGLNCLDESNFAANIANHNFLAKKSNTLVRNRCILTGKSTSVYSRFRLSRIIFREKALFGFFPGIRKAIW